MWYSCTLLSGSTAEACTANMPNRGFECVSAKTKVVASSKFPLCSFEVCFANLGPDRNLTKLCVLQLQPSMFTHRTMYIGFNTRCVFVVAPHRLRGLLPASTHQSNIYTRVSIYHARLNGAVFISAEARQGCPTCICHVYCCSIAGAHFNRGLN